MSDTGILMKFDLLLEIQTCYKKFKRAFQHLNLLLNMFSFLRHTKIEDVVDIDFESEGLVWRNRSFDLHCKIKLWVLSQSLMHYWRGEDLSIKSLKTYSQLHL